MVFALRSFHEVWGAHPQLVSISFFEQRFWIGDGKKEA
jgi:hypothetical protein